MAELTQMLMAASPKEEMNKEEYLSRIKGPIDYEKMAPFPPKEREVWSAYQTPDTILCAWLETYKERHYGIVLVICNKKEGLGYQNPPKEIRRVIFADLTGEKPLDLDSIPQPVARHSLNALPYKGIPTWGWVLIGGAAVAGVAGIVKATKS